MSSLAASAPRTDLAAGPVAAIDVGTNTVRIRVDRPSGGALDPVRIERVITRLGGGQVTGGPLTDEAMARTIPVLARFAAIARAEGATRIRAVATSAVREASNQDAFVARVRAEAGVELEVLPADDEARIETLGVIADLEATGDPVRDALLLDVGGGSTEAVLIRAGRPEGRACLGFGVVRLSERFLAHDPPTRDELDALVSFVASAVAPLASLVERAGPEGLELIANAGTGTSLAAYDLGLVRWDMERVRGHRMELATVERALADLVVIPGAQRLTRPGIERGREDLIVAGLVILREAMRATGIARLRISVGGLLEGLILDSLERDSPERDSPERQNLPSHGRA